MQGDVELDERQGELQNTFAASQICVTHTNLCLPSEKIFSVRKTDTSLGREDTWLRQVCMHIQMVLFTLLCTQLFPHTSNFLVYTDLFIFACLGTHTRSIYRDLHVVYSLACTMVCAVARQVGKL